MNNSPEIHGQLTLLPRAFPNPPVISRSLPHKGGAKVIAGKRFRDWRETDGKSRMDVARAIFHVSRESTKEYRTRLNLENLTMEYLHNCVEEFENSRYKPPTWFILLLLKTYPQLNLPWWEFLDEARSRP